LNLTEDQILSLAPDESSKKSGKDLANPAKWVSKGISSRLEYYLVTQRKWTFQQWQQFFLNNPVMFIYATRLLWGVYEGEDETPPQKTFGDGGFIESFNLLHRGKNLEAILEVDGVYVAFGLEAQEKLGKLFVLDRSKLGKGDGYLFYTKDDDERLAPLNALPPIFLNEVLAAIESIRRNSPE